MLWFCALLFSYPVVLCSFWGWCAFVSSLCVVGPPSDGSLLVQTPLTFPSLEGWTGVLRPLGAGELKLPFARTGGGGAILDDTLSSTTSVSGSIQIGSGGSLVIRGAAIGTGAKLEINGTAGTERLNLTSAGIALAAGSGLVLNRYISVGSNAVVSGLGELVLSDGLTLLGDQNLAPTVLSTCHQRVVCT